MRNTISVLVANEAGELSRIVGLFSARGYNIETICVGKTLEPNWSRCTIVTYGDEAVIEQILKHCQRLARVREAKAVTTLPHIEREMALIDVNAKSGAERQEILNIVSDISGESRRYVARQDDLGSVGKSGQGRYIYRTAETIWRQ